MTRRPGRSKLFSSSVEEFETALLCFCVFDYFLGWDTFNRKRSRSKLRYLRRKKFPLARRSLKKGDGGKNLRGEGQGSSARRGKRPPKKKCGRAPVRRLTNLSKGRRGVFCGTWPCSQTCCGPSGSWRTLGRRAGVLQGKEGVLSVQPGAYSGPWLFSYPPSSRKIHQSQYCPLK